jgi:RimJ/RimL family protein N-acetyltransferase
MDSLWAPRGIRIVSGGLELRPMTEADLPELIAARPADMEEDPRLPTFAGTVAAAQQSYWQALGNWRPEDWRLPFVARRDGVVVGAQDLEGADFARLRTVDTSSWVTPARQGTGIGKAMRLGVLAMAFEHLGAEFAVSSAWPDNAASLGVSRSLGYRPNGVVRHARGDGVDDMVHVRLEREDWLARHAGRHGATVTGVAGCIVYFGP